MASVSPKIPFLRQSSNAYSPPKQQPPRFTFGFSDDDLKTHPLTLESSSPKADSKDRSANDSKQRNSPTSSPKNGFSSTGHLNVDLKRLKSGYLDDEVVYAAMQKLNVILKQQQEKKFKANNPSDDENSGSQSPHVKKNIELMKRIQKFQNTKGMMPKSKEKTFESKLGPFKRLSTFVNIQPVLKDLSDPSTLATPLHSKRKMTSPKTTTAYDGGLRGAVKTPSRFSEIKTPSSPSPFNIKINDIPLSAEQAKKQSSFRLGLKLQPIDIKEEVSEVHQLVEENMKKHLGTEAFDAIQSALQDPKKQREVKAKNRAEIEKLRQTKENLRNNNLFHSLIDHLAVQNKPQGPKLIEDEDGPSPSPFYQKLERVLNQDNRLERGMGEFDGENPLENATEELDTYKQNLIQKLQANLSPTRKEAKKLALRIQTLKDETPDAENDEQVKAATLLNSYRERSKKVLDLLKKKNSILHHTDFKGIKSGRVERHSGEVQSSRFSQFLKPLSNTMALTKVRSSGAADEESKTFGLNSVGTDSGVEDGFTRHALQAMGVSPSEGSMHHYSTVSLNIKNRDKFNRKVIANRRQFTNISQKRPDSNNYSEMIDKGESNDSSLHSTHYIPRRCCTKIKERNTGLKGTKSQFFYENSSMEGIQGQLNSLSLSNRQIQTELKDSMKDMKTFYNAKISSMKTNEIPESLKDATEYIDSTNKKASLIIKLTKRVLRDQIL